MGASYNYKLRKLFLTEVSMKFLVGGLILGFGLMTSEIQAKTRRPTPSLSSTNCSENSKNDLRYCVTETLGSENPNTLYYMHGVQGDEEIWERDGILLRAAWQLGNVDPPRVITLSFGPTWLLGEKNSSSRSGLLERLFQEILPEIERNIEGISNKNRYLFGLSMGGFNAIQMMSYHPEMFVKVALACPAVTTVGPFAPEKEVQEYIKRTKASEENVRFTIALAREYFPTQETWQHAWPLQLADRMGSHFPPVYVSGATKDSFGFQEGDMAFARRAQSRGVKIQTEMVPGPHCLYNGSSIANFFGF